MTRLLTKLPAQILSGMIGFSVFSAAAYAAELDPGGDAVQPQLPAMGALDSLQMIGKVILFLILIIGLFFILIKFLARKNQQTFYGNSVRSLGGVPLGQNKSLQIIEIGHSLFVVGVGDNIQLIEKISDADEVAYVSELLTSAQNERTNFLALSKWIGKLPIGKKDVEEDVDISSFSQVFQDKLQKVSSRNKNVEDWLSEQKQTDRLNDK